MANNFSSNNAEKLLKSFTKNFVSDTVLYQTTGRELVEDYDASTGGVVKMKRPTRYNPIRSDDGDLTGQDSNPIVPGSVLGEVGQYITVLTEMKDIERALEMDQPDELLRPAATDMAVELESEIGLRMIQAAALSAGNIDNAIDSWADVGLAGALLKDVGAPAGNRYCAVSNFTEVGLAEKNLALGVNPEVGNSLSSATIKARYAGFEGVLTTNNLPQVTHGTEASASITLSATPTPLWVNAKDSMQMSLSLAGGTNGGTITAGTQLQITSRHLLSMRNHKTIINAAGNEIAFTCTVLQDATADGSGNYSGVIVSGAAVYETGVNGAFNTVSTALTSGDSVALLGTEDKTYRPAIAYCGKEFFGVGSVMLEPLYSKDSKVINMPEVGLSVRLTMDADTIGNKNFARWDILPTFACYNPFFGVQVGGQ